MSLTQARKLLEAASLLVADGYERERKAVKKYVQEMDSIFPATKKLATEAMASLLSKTNWSRGAKDISSKAFNDVQKLLTSASIAQSTAVSQLRKLPKHAPFDADHALADDFDEKLTKLSKLKSLLSKTVTGDSASVRAGLERVLEALDVIEVGGVL